MSQNNCGGCSGEVTINQEQLPDYCPPEPDCIPSTVGEPENVPSKCDPKLKWQGACCEVTYMYTCDGGWVPIREPYHLLEALDPTVINDVCNRLKMPNFYDENGCCVTGSLTYNQIASLILSCLCLRVEPDPTPATTVLACGTDESGNAIFVERPLDICSLLGNIDPGAPVSPGFGGTFTTLNQNCELVDVTLPTETPPPSFVEDCLVQWVHPLEFFRMAWTGASANASFTQDFSFDLATILGPVLAPGKTINDVCAIQLRHYPEIDARAYSISAFNASVDGALFMYIVDANNPNPHAAGADGTDINHLTFHGNDGYDEGQFYPIVMPTTFPTLDIRIAFNYEGGVWDRVEEVLGINAIIYKSIKQA